MERELVAEFNSIVRRLRSMPLSVDAREAVATLCCKAITPTSEELERIARENPPPQEYFDREEEKPW
jgi:hypothetical protein